MLFLSSKIKKAKLHPSSEIFKKQWTTSLRSQFLRSKQKSPKEAHM